MGRGRMLLQKLAPATFMQVALGPSSAFLSMYGDSPLLCVDLSSSHGAELEAGLAASSSRGDADAQIGFHTAMVASEHDLPSRSFGVRELYSRLERARHYVVPVEKRFAEGISMERITLGRARNKDIVLRHSSVSKSHAWFERDADGEVRVADAGSTNGTHVDGKRLPPREPTPVSYGAPLRFGSVEAFLCEAALLWEVLHD